MKPLVSVIIPTYNRIEYISEAIESVLAQTYRNYEIIVVDDGSTLNVRKTLEPYKNKIRYLYQDNKGLAAARNTGIKDSRGEYLTFLDDDDIFRPRKLEIQASILEKNTEIDLVYSDYYIFGTNNKNKSILSLSAGRNQPTYEFAQSLFLNPNIATPSVMIRHKCFFDVGLFDEHLRAHEDGDMFLRIALNGKVKFSRYISAKVRYHKNKMSFDRVKIYKSEIESAKKILTQNRTFRESLHSKATERMAELYYCLGTELFYIGKYKEAINNYKISKRFSNKYINLKNVSSTILKHALKRIRKLL